MHKHRLSDHLVNLFAISVFVAMTLFVGQCRVAGQDETLDEIKAHLIARVQVSEAGWDNTREHDALAWTLQRRADRLERTRGWSFARTARAYAHRTLAEPRTDRQRWIHALPRSGERSDVWEETTTAAWGTRADRWKAVLDRARAFVRGEIEDPCEGPSEHWGGPVDRHRFVVALQTCRWALVDCGDCENAYARVLSREERRTCEDQRRSLDVRFVD